MPDTSDAPKTAETQNPKYAEADDDVVSLGEATLQRDDEGRLMPSKEYVREMDGYVLARPLTRDERKRFVTDLVEGEKEELSDAELAELFDLKVVNPDLTQHPLCEDGHVTERFVREGLNQSQENGLFIAVLLASGEDDMVRRIRGEFNETELELVKEQMRGEGNPGRGEAPTRR